VLVEEAEVNCCCFGSEGTQIEVGFTEFISKQQFIAVGFTELFQSSNF
jgi:hypothetical protein